MTTETGTLYWTVGNPFWLRTATSVKESICIRIVYSALEAKTGKLR